ncbi:hypothetical protein QFC20_006139 [Naganishia adeliensis]|uniref:Uncharacterized protein n=1 Tax=Naganishia adeliensis TaxID=92952 RepID=A0ACC2VEH4_9TREE|nr:hypothetical protein QFC20_006139 [Naganishia adeliensis]
MLEGYGSRDDGELVPRILHECNITLSVPNNNPKNLPYTDKTREVFADFRTAYIEALHQIQLDSDYSPESASMPTLTIHVSGHRRVGTTTIFRDNSTRHAAELRWYDFDAVEGDAVLFSDMWEM